MVHKRRESVLNLKKTVQVKSVYINDVIDYLIKLSNLVFQTKVRQQSQYQHHCLLFEMELRLLIYEKVSYVRSRNRQIHVPHDVH